MKLAYVLNTTPDEFLIGTLNSNDEEWKKSAELLRPLNSKQLNLVHNMVIRTRYVRQNLPICNSMERFLLLIFLLLIIYYFLSYILHCIDISIYYKYTVYIL